MWRKGFRAPIVQLLIGHVKKISYYLWTENKGEWRFGNRQYSLEVVHDSGDREVA